MAIALWVSLPAHHDEAGELLRKHNDFGRLLAADSLEQHADWLGPVPFDVNDIEALEKQRGELETLFGRYGDRSWVTKSLWEVLKEIEHLWEDETRCKQELWGYYALGHRINNLKLHSSALSLNQAAKKSSADDGNEVIRLGASPTDEESAMIRSIYGALFTYGRITRLIIEETGGDVEEFDTFYGNQLDLAYKLKASLRHKIGRNDECPCGSGKKYKHCHGAG
jgi:SEC-C motif